METPVLVALIAAVPILASGVLSFITIIGNRKDAKYLNDFRSAITKSVDTRFDEFNSNCMGHVASTLAYMVSENSSYDESAKRKIGIEILDISKDEIAKEKVRTILNIN